MIYINSAGYLSENFKDNVKFDTRSFPCMSNQPLDSECSVF